MTKRLTHDAYVALGNKSGFRWVGNTLPQNNNTNTDWFCPNGHVFSAPYGRLQSGCGCPYCAGNIRKTIEDYASLSRENGITWEGGLLPASTHVKTKWGCSCGEQWTATYDSIRAKNTTCCPKCAGKKRWDGRKHTAAEYQQLATSRGIQWIGELPNSITGKSRWRCHCGYEWETPFHSIKRGSGCPYCANHIPLTIEDFRNVGRDQNIEWAGDIIVNARAKTRWRCVKGHEWETRYYVIKRGSGCPICNNAESGRKRQIPTEKYIDLAEKRGIFFIGLVSSKQRIAAEWQCQQGHKWIAPYAAIAHGKGCKKCGASRANEPRRIRPEQYHQMALEHGLVWLGESVTNVNAKTRWKCQNGHVWETTYTHVARGQECPQCQHIINGRITSRPQRSLHETIGGEINKMVGKYAIDIALVIEGVAIGIEYDCNYWHDPDYDAKRDRYLQSKGWRMLRVKSGTLLPTRAQLDTAIKELLSGKLYAEIVLPDWKE